MAEKNRKAKIVYLNEAGEEVKITAGGIAAIRYDFADNRQLTLDLSKIGPNVWAIAGVRGVAEKTRDEYAGADDVDEAYEWAKDMIERLYGDEWMGAREGGGPSISWFIEAVKSVKAARAAELGNEYDPEGDDADLRAKYVGKDKAKARNNALAGNAALRAKYDAMLADAAEKKAARARERAAKSGAAATGAEVTDASL